MPFLLLQPLTQYLEPQKHRVDEVFHQIYVNELHQIQLLPLGKLNKISRNFMLNDLTWDEMSVHKLLDVLYRHRHLVSLIAKTLEIIFNTF